MKHTLSLLFAALVIGFSGCKDFPVDAPIADYTLTFKAAYDGQPLEKYKGYPYADYTVRFTRFQTYISDLILLRGNEEVKLLDIDFVDFTPDDATDNFAVDVPFTFQIPEGTYTGLKIGFGVKPDLNAKKPSDFPAGHVLTKEVEYWLPWNSYIFTKVEGQGDTDNNGADDVFLLYHCGSNAVYRTVQLNQAIEINAASHNNTLVMDLKKLFTINGQFFDLKVPGNQFTSNNPNNVTIATILMDNIGNCVELQ